MSRIQLTDDGIGYVWYDWGDMGYQNENGDGSDRMSVRSLFQNRC